MILHLDETTKSWIIPLIISIVVVILGWLIKWIATILWQPIDFVRRIDDKEARASQKDGVVRYAHQKTTDGSPYAVLNQVKSAGFNILPPYPNGWFRVARSNTLKCGDVLPLRVFGRDLVLFRTSSGVARVMDAWCPHLGANLAVGGKVVNENIQCPFHGWQFEGSSGNCTHIPYSDGKIPEIAKVRAYCVQEYLGQVMIWYDAEDRDPQWQFPPVDDWCRYVWHCGSEHDVRAHIAEIPENGADVAHLGFLHEPLVTGFLGVNQLLKHRWTATWAAGENDEEHLAHITINQSLEIFGRTLPFSRVHVKVTQIGMGCVSLFMHTPFGIVVLVENVTPRGPLFQRVGHSMYAEPKVPRWFVKMLFNGTITQFERDVPIWNNKIYLQKPILVKGDGPISAYRRWLKKHYSESSDQWRERASALEW